MEGVTNDDKKGGVAMTEQDAVQEILAHAENHPGEGWTSWRFTMAAYLQAYAEVFRDCNHNKFYYDNSTFWDAVTYISNRWRGEANDDKR